MKLQVVIVSDFEVWPGPMEGVGNNCFVSAVTALQLTDRWMSPFIRVTDNIPASRKLYSSISGYLNSGLPVIVQLLGHNPELLGRCGSIMLEHHSVVGINLNLGCPSSRVVRHGGGGGLLRNPEKAVDVCLKTASLLPVGKLSVKLRAGFDDPDDMEKILPPLVSSGMISKIFFHYRTVCELYDPSVLPLRDERITRAVKLCSEIPLIANGDIRDVSEAEHLVRVSGCAGVMIARPWMRDPFLLSRFHGIGIEPEEGRERFFNTLREAGISGGALIEMAKMLWGRESERFSEILTEEKK